MNPENIFNKTLGDNRKSNKIKIYNQKQKAKSVFEAKRIHSGNITVLGTIVSLSDLYVVVSKTKWHCDNDYCNFNGEMSHNPPLSLPMTGFDSTDEKPTLCPKCKFTGFSVTLTHRDAKFVQLEDTEKTDENERLDVIAYDNLTTGLVAGEVVEMTGSIRVQRKAENSKSKKLVNVLHAKSIDYVNRVNVTVTNNDIKNFFKWKDICERTCQRELNAVNRYKQYPQCPECCKWADKIIPMTFRDRLVAMFAPDVIGQEEAKLGILRSAVGGIEDDGRRGRINTLLVGDPGTAKSKIIRAATEIKPNSRYVNAQNSSTKSLMAIVDRENDSLVLRLGPIPLSKHAICAINELNQMTLDDQARLVDVLEEGRFNKGAYGLWFEIESPTTIIASANPINATWEDASAISNDEVSILKNLLDRFDQIFGFRDNFTEKEAQSFAEKMSMLRKKDKSHNHNFLRKYLVYASGLAVKVTPEADYMLNKFWVKGKVSVTMKNRMYAEYSESQKLKPGCILGRKLTMILPINLWNLFNI